MQEVATPDINVDTVEDPVEYRMDANNQVPVNPKRGLTFAGALRSILRQDPDVVLVGEIRDTETADIAIKAALTGHLVMSTLHTNDAPSTVTRLLNMGAPAYLLASTLVGILAQRLVRRICAHCAGSGCRHCRNGLRGRTGVYEVMPVTHGIKALLVSGGTEDVLRQRAREEGMMLLSEDAARLVTAGVTTAREARPLLQADHC